ncbi:MAG: DUF86 domain-containing protein [Candidatus Omnitrophota bacterium]
MPQPPEDRNAAYVWDMFEAARNVTQFISGMGIDEYLKDRKLQLAIERSLEIIGEAAKNISTEYQRCYPDIPWRKIISQRNVIAHEYGEIKQERIWTVASLNVPELVQQLEPLLKAFQI